MSHLIEAIENDKVSSDFNQITLVIDGFTRFLLRKERVVDLLHGKGVEIVIGAYASKKAYTSPFSEGNLYQASVKFLHHLASKYQTPAQDCSQTHEKMDSLTRPLVCWSLLMTFQNSLWMSMRKDRENLQIWSCLTQRRSWS